MHDITKNQVNRRNGMALGEIGFRQVLENLVSENCY